MKRKNEKTASWGHVIWVFALILAGVGIILFPIHIREPLLRGVIGTGRARANWLLAAAVVLMMLTKRKYSRTEWMLGALWLALWIPVILSNQKHGLGRIIPAIINCCLPLFLLLQRIETRDKKKTIRIVLFVFNCFIFVLLLVGVHEKLTGQGWMHAFVPWMKSHGYKCKEFKYYLKMYDAGMHRYFSFWGHPLTNSVLFNGFFILNDIYYRSIQKRYPRLLFFAVALAGVLLCVSKTAIVVVILYLVIANGFQKKWVGIYAVGGAAMYAMGIFNRIIHRFTSTSLTTGRVAALKRYFAQPKYPLRFFLGYGSGTTYGKTLFKMKPAFEFPVLMFSLDYGILFALLYMGSLFLYYTYEFLKRKEIVSWLGLSLLFAEINTYNGFSLRNQDVCWMFCLISMLAINCISLTDDPVNLEEQTEIQGGKWKKFFIQILCGE